jgi:hypothetical protein
VDVQRTGRIFGWLFIGTFVTSIPARLLFVHGVGASWSNMRFVPGNISNASIELGAVLEFGLIVTEIGTAVVIYSLVRRQSETLSLGYVSARIIESVFTAIGLMNIISVVSVADSLGSPGADSAALRIARHAGAHLRLGVPVGARTRRRDRERADPRRRDVPVRARAAAHGDARSDRWPAADPLPRPDPVRGIQERRRTVQPAHTP